MSSDENLHTFHKFATRAAAERIDALTLSCVLMKTLPLLAEADTTLGMGGLS